MDLDASKLLCLNKLTACGALEMNAFPMRECAWIENFSF